MAKKEENVTNIPPETAVKTPVAEVKTKKKNTALIVIIVVVVVLVLLGIGSVLVSRFVFRKAGESFIEKLIEHGTGSNVDIDTKDGSASIKTSDGSTTVGNSAQWPSDMPSDVPKFSAGKITMSTKVSTDPKSWSLLISEVKASDVASYKSALKAKGWTEDTSMSFGADLTQYTKGNLETILTFDSTSNGLSITVSYKTAS